MSYHFEWKDGELFDWDEYPENYSREETYKKNHAELLAKVESEKKRTRTRLGVAKEILF